MGCGKRWSRGWLLAFWLGWQSTAHHAWGRQRRNTASCQFLFCLHLLCPPLKCVVPWGSLFTCVSSLLAHLFSKSVVPPTYTSTACWWQDPKGTPNSVYHLSLRTCSTSVFKLIESNLLSTYLEGESGSRQSWASHYPPHTHKNQPPSPKFPLHHFSNVCPFSPTSLLLCEFISAHLSCFSSITTLVPLPLPVPGPPSTTSKELLLKHNSDQVLPLLNTLQWLSACHSRPSMALHLPTFPTSSPDTSPTYFAFFLPANFANQIKICTKQ